MTNLEKLLSVARGEVGYAEKATNDQLDDPAANAGNRNYTKYARDLDALGAYNTPKNGYAWCAVFVLWCFDRVFGLETAQKMLAQVKGGTGAGCTPAVRNFKAVGRFCTTPEAGDQIFFTSDGGVTSNHTGIVAKIENGRVYTIEGNTSAADGVVANGGRVAEKSYALTDRKIYGYGRPDWSLAPAEKWNEAARAWGMGLGITDGTRPADPVTREECWAMLQRLWEKMGGA